MYMQSCFFIECTLCNAPFLFLHIRVPACDNTWQHAWISQLDDFHVLVWYENIFYKCGQHFFHMTHSMIHDDVIKWKPSLRYLPFVRGIHRSPVNSPHKGQWHGALMFSLICVWTTDWVKNRDAGDLRGNRAHYDVTVMITSLLHYRPIGQ